MSTLTKIFIVVMVIFSIAFTMTTISFVAQTDNWRQLAKDYQAHQIVVETNMRNLSAGHAADKTVWLDAKKDLDNRIGDLKQARNAARTELAKAQEDVIRLRSEKNGSDALANRLASLLQVAENGWLEQRDQRAELKKRNREVERRNLDLNERVNEQTAQILVLVQQQRQLEQQVNILREESAKLAGGGRLSPGAGTSAATTASAQPVTAPSATPIRGHIVEVQGKLATISVGSYDGVAEGMVFVIYRDSEYIGDIKITDVEPNLAAGRLIRSRAAPRPDDMVADEPALGSVQ